MTVGKRVNFDPSFCIRQDIKQHAQNICIAYTLRCTYLCSDGIEITILKISKISDHVGNGWSSNLTAIHTIDCSFR